jgi:carbon storage regulator
MLGPDITLTVLAIEGDRVKLGIQAPRDISVLRRELLEQLQDSNVAPPPEAPAVPLSTGLD